MQYMILVSHHLPLHWGLLSAHFCNISSDALEASAYVDTTFQVKRTWSLNIPAKIFVSVSTSLTFSTNL